MRLTPLIAFVCTLSSFGLGACADSPRGAMSATLEQHVLASSLGVAYLARRIAGDAVEVHCAVDEDADPALWQPERDDLEAFQRARLIALSGANFESWVKTASLPLSRVVDASAPFEDQFLRFEKETVHSHGGAGEHTHSGIDGHTFMDPLLAREQAGALRDALAAAWPQHAAGFEQRDSELGRDLMALDARFREVSELLGEGRVFTSHPAYNYLARRYGWDVVNFDLDPEAPLAPEDASEIRAAAQAGPVAVFFWEGSPAPATAAAVREACGAPGSLFATNGPDYLALQTGNLERLQEALTEDR